MMKFYANLFELTADSISKKSIQRLRWLTLAALPIVPLTIFLFLEGLPDGYMAIPILIVLIMSMICSSTVLLTRVVNRVWSPDKYLDEWERDLKRKSMTLAFMVVIYVALGLILALEFFGGLIEPLVAEYPTSLTYLFLFILISTGFFAQVFKQLSLIEPIEEDELDKPEYVVTSARSVLGAIALVLIIFLSGLFLLGYSIGHWSEQSQHAAAEDVCGDADVNTHKRTEETIDVTCEGSDRIYRLDLETLKPI